MAMNNSTPTSPVCQEQISKNSLNELERTLTASLDAVRKAQGRRTDIDAVQRLCNQAGITKRQLAAGIVLGCKGDITMVDLASKLEIGYTTIKRWTEVRTALRAMRAY